MTIKIACWVDPLRYWLRNKSSSTIFFALVGPFLSSLRALVHFCYLPLGVCREIVGESSFVYRDTESNNSYHLDQDRQWAGQTRQGGVRHPHWTMHRRGN